MRVSTDCFRYVKDTILKANHNPYQSTLHVKQLFPICQRYNFESKSQPKLSEEDIKINCFRYVKDTILKANHNLNGCSMAKNELFSICQRYNFESKTKKSL